VLEDCTLSLITERRVSRPWGLAGGQPGARGENWLLPDGDESRAERLADKCTVGLRAGDAHSRSVLVSLSVSRSWGSSSRTSQCAPS